MGIGNYFLQTILLSLITARFLNGYNTKLYSLKTTISVKEETNPLFSSGTNLTFNWGGASDIIETVNIILRSRTHNEKVVSKLQFYIDYLKDGKYRFEDVYGETPFKVIVNEKNFQLYNRLLKIETLDNNQFKISTDFKDENSVKLVKYANNTFFRKELIKDEKYTKTFYFNDNDSSSFNVKDSFLSLNIYTDQLAIQPNQVYYIKLNNFNSTVATYKDVLIKNITDGGSILELGMTGKNKNRIVDYLNQSVQVLAKDKQQQKTLYATKTVKYIDDLFKKESDNLGIIQREMGDFKKSNNIYNLSSEGEELLLQTSTLSLELKKTEKNIEELNILESYIRSNTIYEQPVPVPAFIQIADIKISSMIDELILESTKLEFL